MKKWHVDGGALAQAFLYPPSLNLKKLEKRLRTGTKHKAYVIRNGQFCTDLRPTSKNRPWPLSARPSRQ